MRYSSFSVFLNFLLTLIIIVGGFTVYKIGNFDGVDMTALKKNYINKKSLKFSDLSKDEQIKYISKNSIEGGNKNSINSIGGLRSIIKNLKNKFLIIQNDNLMLYNEKQKLAKLLKKSKNLLNEQKRNLTTKNLEQISETERQHYRNISELTTKINDLKRENIELSQDNNAKTVELENMKKEKQALKDSFLSKIEKNEKKHNENYKILNKQILKYKSEIAKIEKNKNDFIKTSNMPKNISAARKQRFTKRVYK